eukprot:scaffold3300_cov239-Pinguiococcus_pyrenoidosus.AAC.6
MGDLWPRPVAALLGLGSVFGRTLEQKAQQIHPVSQKVVRDIHFVHQLGEGLRKTPSTTFSMVLGFSALGWYWGGRKLLQHVPHRPLRKIDVPVERI